MTNLMVRSATGRCRRARKEEVLEVAAQYLAASLQRRVAQPLTSPSEVERFLVQALAPRDAEVFWSKPVLTYWLMSIGMHIAGVGLPGNDPAEMALTNKAEWAVRVPFCLLGIVAMWAIYHLVSRFVSRRAGFLSAIVVATTSSAAAVNAS